MKIKNIQLKNNLILAPMAGVTDVGFRTLALSYGADYAVCEMVSAKALKYKNKKTSDLLITHPNEKIKVAQIFGSDPNIMANIVKSNYMQPFDIIDINMGCPAPKITKNGEGSALMQNMGLASEIISKCVQATDKPITVKFRAGWSEDSINAVEFAKMCEKAGASAITIHGRTKQQGYSGKSDFEIIKHVKQNVSIPVIGNGDVVDKESYQHMLNYCKVDGVMVGRGSLGKPWIFAQILDNKKPVDVYGVICEHINILKQYYPETFIVKHMRKHILWYLQNIKGAKQQKNSIILTKTLQEMLQKTKELIDNN